MLGDSTNTDRGNRHGRGELPDRDGIVQRPIGGLLHVHEAPCAASRRGPARRTVSCSPYSVVPWFRAGFQSRNPALFLDPATFCRDPKQTTGEPEKCSNKVQVSGGTYVHCSSPPDSVCHRNFPAYVSSGVFGFAGSICTFELCRRRCADRSR